MKINAINTPTLKEKDFIRFSKFIYEKCGICLHEGKKELVRARLNKRLRETGISDFEEYYDYMINDKTGEEMIVMIDAISTNMTSFYREKQHFDFLYEHVFPDYKKGKFGKRLRFWSSACSSGEEPYTIAICFFDFFGLDSDFDVKILATDISTKVLETAQSGIYPAERTSGIPMEILKNYFQKGKQKNQGLHRVKRDVKRIIKFKRLNLMETFPFKPIFNFIFCRNVMIYFDKITQENLINKFYDCIVPEGYLMIGHSESMTGINHKFKYIKPSIYQK